MTSYNLSLSKQEEEYFINQFINHINTQEKVKTEKIISSLEKKNDTSNLLTPLITQPISDKSLISQPDVLPNEKTEDRLKNKINKNSNRLKSILQRSKNKLKLQTKTKEMKFTEKMQAFVNLDTFIDIKEFLHEMNLTNTPDFEQILRKIKRNLRQDTEGKYYLVEDNKKPKEDENIIKDYKGKIFQNQTNKIKNYNDRIKKIKEESQITFNPKKLLDIKIGDYLMSEEEKPADYKAKSDFSNILLERIRSNELFRETSDQTNLYKDQERVKREIKLLQDFLIRNKEEHFFKEEICKGIYLQAFRNQAYKIRQLLTKASKNIFHKKSISIDHKIQGSSSILSPDHIETINSSNKISSFFNTNNNNSTFQATSPIGKSPKVHVSNNKNDLICESKKKISDTIENENNSFKTFLTSVNNKNKTNQKEAEFSKSKDLKLSIEISPENKKLMKRVDFVESPINLRLILKRIPRNSLDDAEKLLKQTEEVLKDKKDLQTMKKIVLPRLSQDFDYLDTKNVKKFLIAEKNHKENQRIKKAMGLFLDKIEKNIKKNRKEKLEYDIACDKIFEDSEKNYEKLFPKVLESVQIQQKEVIEIEGRRNLRGQRKNKSLGSKKKLPL